MKKYLLLAVLLLASGTFAACSRVATGDSSGAGSRNVDQSLTFDGMKRTYHVHLTPAYDGQHSLPLVLALHGLGGDGLGMAALTHLNTVADAQQFIAVYPDGLNRRWSYSKALDGVDDVGFLVALVQQLEKDYKIDQQRVYVTGISNGGGMVEILACTHADLFAAFGDVAATLSPTLASLCHPSRPIPYLMIHGTDDPLVPYNGGKDFSGVELLSAPESAQTWSNLDGCNPTPATSDLPDKVNDSTHVQRATYSGCQQGSEVVFYTVQGGGHAWPGGLQYLPVKTVGKSSNQMDASQVIWEFFQKHPK
jgi:polyhydroxybutyrate depolymerase